MVGTHGSKEKAGKVKWANYNGRPRLLEHKKHKKNPCPRIRNRRNFEKRIILHRKSGQNYAR